MPLIQTFAGASARGYRSFGGGVSPSFESISTFTTTGGTQANFNTIPQTYKHLQIRATANVAVTGATGTFIVNGLAGTDYDWQGLAQDNTTAIASSVANTQPFQTFGLAKTITLGYPFGCIIDIIDYASTSKYKTVRIFSAAPSNTAGGLELYSGQVRTLTAVTSLSLRLSQNYAASTSVALYGIN